MCGIVGFVGKDNHLKKDKKSLSVLIDGLRHLQYRGYDSAGIAFVINQELVLEKEVGIESIDLLEQKITTSMDSNLGIGHTRWATHGGANVLNCHPHQVGEITLVHNGIIENYNELKKELISLGYTFQSETDTEIGAALLDYLYSQAKDMKLAIQQFIQKVNGAYALGVINSDEKDTLYALRKDSPLIVGIGDKTRNYIASDILAIADYTKNYMELKNESFAIIKKNTVTIFNKDGKAMKPPIKTYSGNKMEISQNGEESFTLKEIKEQSVVFQESLKQYQKNDITNLMNYTKFKIVACGSAYHAGLIGKYLIEKYAEIPVDVEIASEYRYHKILDSDSKTLVIGISQSGETADTIKALEHAKEYKLTTLGIINSVGSSMERITDYVIHTCAGKEIGVATTKAYSAQITELAFLAMKLGLSHGIISTSDFMDIENQLKTFSKKIDSVLNCRETYFHIAKQISNKNDVFFLGRGIDFALAMEGSLKLKELSYIHSEAYAAGELKHGTISLIEQNTPVIALMTDQNFASKTMSNCKEVMSRGANVIPIVTDSISNLEQREDAIVIPTVHPLLQPILAVIPMQFIAYEVAILKECNVDKPRNLAKSVTVE